MLRQNDTVAGDHRRYGPLCQADFPRAAVRGLHCDMDGVRATKHFRAVSLELTASGLLARFFGEALEHLPQHARACHPLREVEPARPAVQLKLQPPGIAADASPVPVAIAEQPRCIKSYGGKMFRVRMGDDLG